MKIVLGVDIGTTNIRCYAYNNFANIVGKAHIKLPIITSENGKYEVEPNVLWSNFLCVVNDCLKCSNLKAKEISCLGISTQRGTFVTWDRETGETYHNFITWKDRRSTKLCQEWNESFTIKMIRIGAFILYLLTQNTRYKVASAMKFSPTMALMRLMWILQNNVKVKTKINDSSFLFGTIDTWIIWKLTGGKVHATDASNACVTGLFDPFLMQWSSQILGIFQIPLKILPLVKNTCDDFGKSMNYLFGSSIPIYAVVGDQQASMFGSCSFNKYDINCTMGTGLFVNMNTGSSPLPPYHNIYPIVGWTISSKATYLIECGLPDCGTVISWLQTLGFIDNPEQSSCLAESTTGSEHLYFFSRNSMIGSDVNDNSTFTFIGLKAHHTKSQIVRSVLEAVAFQVCQIFDKLKLFYGAQKNDIFQVCGGVGKNNFIIQLLSDVMKKQIIRLENNECSCTGAAFLAGLHCGVWENLEQICLLVEKCQVFCPKPNEKESVLYQMWKSKIKNFL